MSTPEAFESLLRDPAPGLVLGGVPGAGIGPRAVPTPHIVRAGAGWFARRGLRQMLRGGQGALGELVEFVRSHDGVSLCLTPDGTNGTAGRAALSFLPFRAWDEATDTAEWNDDGRLLHGLDEVYRPGGFLVIGSSPNEGTLLTVLLEDGEHPLAKAGALYYLSLRPVCDRTAPLAPSMNGLLERIAHNPAGFFHSIGFTGRATAADGSTHNVGIESYVPDIRGHADLCRAAA